MGHDEQVEEMEVLDSIFPEELTSKPLPSFLLFVPFL